MPTTGTDNLTQIAKVLKSNGSDGEILLGFIDADPADIDLTEPVFIFFDGRPVPFFFESFTIRGSRVVARLNDFTTLRDAEEIVGRELWAEGWEDEEEEEEDLTGWTLMDATLSPVGKITGYEDIPGNTCIYVETPGGEKLIPLHEDLVVSADPEKRTIAMDIPSGLL